LIVSRLRRRRAPICTLFPYTTLFRSHFRLEFTPSSGEEIQSEYFVPREQIGAALAAVMPLGERIRPLLHASEVRTVAADELWLSDRKSTRLNSSHVKKSYAVFCLKKK